MIPEKVVTTKYMRLVKEKASCENGEKEIWKVRNRKTDILLGTIEYMKDWRKYCFYPLGKTVFSPDCLESLIKHIKALEEGG